MDEKSRKAILRRTVLARRSRLSEGERAAAGRALAGRLIAHPVVAKAQTVLAFASFGTEIPTDAFLQELLERGTKLFLPYVSAAGSMDTARVDTVEDLSPGYRGIREPLGREPVAKANLDVVVVPGVAFDPKGHRLGHGGGFYDRYLAEVPRRVPRLGVCFDLQVVDEVPAVEHDQPVDFVITERRTLECSPRDA